MRLPVEILQHAQSLKQLIITYLFIYIAESLGFLLKWTGNIIINITLDTYDMLWQLYCTMREMVVWKTRSFKILSIIAD